MKKLMLLAATAITALSMSAQSFNDFFSTEKPSEKVTFGFRFGLNINGMRNNISNNDVAKIFCELPYKIDVHNKAGINFGVSVDIPIFKSLWINTGAYYSSTGVKFNLKQDNSKSYKDFLIDYTANVTMHNVRVPIQASYRYNFTKDYQLQVNLGPYFAYGFAGKANVKADNNGDKIGSLELTGNPSNLDIESVEYRLLEGPIVIEKDPLFIQERPGGVNTNKSNYINPFDMGISFGAGVTFLHKYYAGFNYDGGLVNVNGKRANALRQNSMKNHVFSINIGYNF